MPKAYEIAPHMNYSEEGDNYFAQGTGAKPTIVIGKSPIVKDLENILTFKSYNKAKALPENGGIGPEPIDDDPDNPLLAWIKDYFQEGAKQTSSDIGVKEIHVINVGPNPSVQDWLAAAELSNKKKNIRLETYVENHDISFMHSIDSHLQEQSKLGITRVALFSVENEDMSDEDMMKYTDDSQATSIQKSRIGISQKDLFGKIVARIAVTPYYEEPGYAEFRTVEPGTFKERSRDERNELVKAGIIFGEDNPFTEKEKVQICLATSTSFAIDESNRPADSLLHHRFNVDEQVNQLLLICAEQLKRNETSDYLAYLEQDCVSYLEKEIARKRIKSYDIAVEESDNDPYALIIHGKIQPVNSTHAILFENYIEAPGTKA